MDDDWESQVENVVWLALDAGASRAEVENLVTAALDDWEGDHAAD
jgi:hypothetical protein